MDEYVPSRDHGTLVRELESLAGNKNMKLCVASRPWQTFQTHFGNFRHRLALHDFTISDMESYISANLIKAEVDTGLGTSFHDHERDADAFVKAFARKAEGVFLWAVLIVRSLCQEIEAGRSVRDLRRYVDKTPLDLKTFFTTMIVERIDYRDQSAVARLLKCATLLAEAHMAAVKDAGMVDHEDENLHMSFLNFSILANSDEAEQPDFASKVQIQPLYIADMKVMLEKTRRYIGRMSRDLLHIPLDEDIHDDLNVRDMDELSQVWEALATNRVEFLHRAVLDYLLDADVQYLLNQRVPSHFHRPEFVARITLARLKVYPKLQLCEAFPELVPAGVQDISMVGDLHRLTESWTPRDREDLRMFLNGAPVERDVEHCPELDTYFSAAVASLMSSTVGERWESDTPHICYRADSPDLSLSLLAEYE